MTRLVLDSGGVTGLARRRQHTAALVTVLKRDGLWPPTVPSVVLVESLSGQQHTDAHVNRLLKTCDIVEQLPAPLARRAGALRTLAGQGSAVDAVVVAMAEPGGTVLGSDLKDLRALAAFADDVIIHRL
ncbi:MAG TPA: hypothetical protein VNA57_09120 [Acidimicrobiales bacterium]|nr:hypothetical protein [Acidimicrobiales bacterium]